jgi:hypothetical protein
MAAGSTYTPIATTTLGSNQNTITFSSITGSYTDLILVADSNSTGAVTIELRFNNDSGSNYSQTRLYGNGSSAVSDRHSNLTFIPYVAGTVSSTTLRANGILQVQNYSNTTTNKTCLIRANSSSDAVTALVGLYRSTSAITRIDLACGSATDFRTGSTFTLYGIAAA